MNGAIQTFVWFTLCSRNKGLKPQIYYKTHRSLCKWLSYYFKTRKHNMVVEIVFDCNNIFNYTYLGSLGYVNDFECQENHLCINIWEVRWILIRGTSSKNGKMNKKKRGIYHCYHISCMWNNKAPSKWVEMQLKTLWPFYYTYKNTLLKN